MGFLAGERATAADLNDATSATQSTTDIVAGTTTSTSYTDTLTGTGTLTHNFVAPASGKIAVTVTAELQNSTTAYTTMSFRISGAAGTLPADDNNGPYMFGAVRVRGSVLSLITGLSPGAAGTITLQHKVTGGTGTFNRRRIMVENVT